MNRYRNFVHIYNGILLSYKKECIWVSPNEVDEPRAYRTEWSQSERERQIYISACVWSLERWCWWTYLWGKNRGIDIEKSFVGTVGEGEGGMNWESSMETYTLPCVTQPVGVCCETQAAQPSALCQPRGGVGAWWEGGSGGRGHMHTCGWFMLR